MIRILVVNDAGLWISLNRHLASMREVHLSEAPSLDAGLRLARMERPDLLVCSTDGLEQDTGQLARMVGDLPERTRVLCVDRGAPAGVPEEARFMTCRRDQLLASVDLFAAPSDSTPKGVPVDMLAHFELRTGTEDEPRRGFANLIEFGPAEVLMESDEALEVGDRLDLTFFVPAAAGDKGASRRKISLRCDVAACRDEGKLLYTADFQSLDDDSEEALQRYVADRKRTSESNP
ncbi:MAG: hypothetical protein ACQGVK_12415 [Myxococcota bacterium]